MSHMVFILIDHATVKMSLLDVQVTGRSASLSAKVEKIFLKTGSGNAVKAS